MRRGPRCINIARAWHAAAGQIGVAKSIKFGAEYAMRSIGRFAKLSVPCAEQSQSFFLSKVCSQTKKKYRRLGAGGEDWWATVHG